jgi:hypothetical protein
MPGLWRANVGQRPCGNKPGISFSGRRRMPGLCCDLGGYAGNKPGTTFSVHKNHRREEVFTSTSFGANCRKRETRRCESKITDFTWSLSDHLKEFHYG